MRDRKMRVLVEVIGFDILVALIVALVASYPVMLAAGAIHSQYHPFPALGWWTTFVVSFAGSTIIEVVQTMFKDGAKTKDS